MEQQHTEGAAKAKRPYNWRGNEDKWCKPLRDFVCSLDDLQQKDFAKRCGTSLGNVKQMMYGERGIKERHAIAFDRESNGKVSIFDTRPDVNWDHVVKAVRRKRSEQKKQ